MSTPLVFLRGRGTFTLPLLYYTLYSAFFFYEDARLVTHLILYYVKTAAQQYTYTVKKKHKTQYMLHAINQYSK